MDTPQCPKARAMKILNDPVKYKEMLSAPAAKE
jgi:hypothetical protein